jgi:hypothetical protein
VVKDIEMVENIVGCMYAKYIGKMLNADVNGVANIAKPIFPSPLTWRGITG